MCFFIVLMFIAVHVLCSTLASLATHDPPISYFDFESV
jgi:hypothetical protein